jgi:hypothetical protein
MDELILAITLEEDHGFCAECLSENIFTQGDTWDALLANIQEAVRGFYFDQKAPTRISVSTFKVCNSAREGHPQGN